MIFDAFYNRKKRAISPVIAVILLIGLAVAAVAAIFIVVLPLMEPTSNLELTDAYVTYDSSYTKTVDEGKGYGKGFVILANAGTGKIELTEIKIEYKDPVTEIWETIPDAVSLQDITVNTPYEINPLAIDEELTVRFEIPTANIKNTVSYKIIITTGGGTVIDTTKESVVDDEEMLLIKDEPNLTLPSSISADGKIRRTYQLSPQSVSDNSEIKNVTYEIFHNNGTKVRSKAITGGYWRWTWDTLKDTTEGLDNGTYSVRMTASDFAGLSYTPPIDLDFEIDNDYIDPVISSITGSSVKNGPEIAEVGESFAVSATITDSGSYVSTVSEAYIYYKLNDSSIDYSSIVMAETTGNVWQGNIPASFVDSDALESNLTYFLLAVDDDENSAISGDSDAGVLDTTQPDITQHIPVTEADYDSSTPPSITLSVTVEDKDAVDQVNLVWREGNDTGLLIADPWKVENFITQSGNTWEFSIPVSNVTIDGLDYYINASDPSGNTNDGSISSPYHITINDKKNPEIHFNPTLPSPTSPGQDVTVRVVVDDNDPSFSSFIYETGLVRVSYKIDSNPWSSPFTIPHTVGESSLGEDGVWEDAIDSGNFTELTTVFIRVEAIDQGGQITTIETQVDVSEAGKPIFRYVEDSVVVSGGSSHILSFNVKNDVFGNTEANAIITNITTTLSVNTKGSYIGTPYLVQIDASGVGIGGTDPRWTNVSSPSEGISGYEAVLANTIDIEIQETVTLTLTYANSSGGYFDINDMNVTVRFGYTYASGTSSGYSDNPSISEISTPITVFQTVTETRYLRSDQQLGTTQSTGFQTLNERSDRWAGSESVYWYIQVWVRKADTSMTEISVGHAAEVFRSTDGSGLQSGSWILASNYNLDPTDSVVVRVFMQIGSTTFGPVEFVSEQLGAEELVAGTWTVWYYTERDYDSRWNQDRTRGILYYGDSTYNSRILNFAYTSQSGGAGAMIMSPLSSVGDFPRGPILYTSERVYQPFFLNERIIMRFR